VFYADSEGVEHVAKFSPENWWSVDLESFALQTAAFYNIQAIENTDLFQISKANYEQLFDRIPKFERFSRMMFQNSYIMLQHRMTQNLFSSAEEKYQHFIAKYPMLEGRIPQKDLASYLGITPEFLSMLRRKWTRAPIS
jgi:CRP-like cAMP-binding protein